MVRDASRVDRPVVNLQIANRQSIVIDAIEDHQFRVPLPPIPQPELQPARLTG